MPLPVSELCSSGPNFSSRSSDKRDPTYRCLLQFSDRFLDPNDEISKWYDIQPFRRFQTIRYCKERTAIGHEFIILLLHGKDSGDVTHHCRVERFGNPEHLAEVMCIDGTIAKDYIQAIPLDDPGFGKLTYNSDTIAEITFPLNLAFDLRDVLAICYGISKHFRAKRYTLQQYNCYFFSWTLVLSLARACMDWDVSASVPEYVDNVRVGIIQSIDQQGPARFQSMTYILSNNTLANYKNGEEHPLDQAIKCRLGSPEFSSSITEGLRNVLWTDRLRNSLLSTIGKEMASVAGKSAHLIAYEEVRGKTVFSSDPQAESHLRLRYALDKPTQEAIMAAFELRHELFRIIATLSSTSLLLKQRLGNELWFKALLYSIRRRNVIFLAEDLNFQQTIIFEITRPRQRRSAIRDLYFLLLSVALEFSLCLAFGFFFALVLLFKQGECNLKGYGTRNKSYFRRTVTLIGMTVWSVLLEIGRMPTHYTFVKHVLDVSLVSSVERHLDSVSNESMRQAVHASGLYESFTQVYYHALQLFDNGLQELVKEDGEYQLNILRPCVFMSVNAILSVVEQNLKRNWELILQYQYMGRMKGAAEIELKPLIEQAEVVNIFRVIEKNNNALSQANDQAVTDSSTDNAGGIENAILPHSTGLATSGHFNSWSYHRLQQYIRERISQLSRRENSFAPYLKHIRFAKSAKVCQKEIEEAMEQIWKACSPLMVTRPRTDRNQSGEAVRL